MGLLSWSGTVVHQAEGQAGACNQSHFRHTCVRCHTAFSLEVADSLYIVEKANLLPAQEEGLPGLSQQHRLAHPAQVRSAEHESESELQMIQPTGKLYVRERRNERGELAAGDLLALRVCWPRSPHPTSPT